MPIYSHGIDSPVKISISRRDAEAYNRVTKAFLDWQQFFFDIEGRPWTKGDPINLENEQPIKRGDIKRHNRVASKITDQIAIFGRPIYIDKFSSDYLIKN